MKKLIIIISIVVAAATGYIVYNHFIQTPSVETATNTNSPQPSLDNLLDPDNQLLATVDRGAERDTYAYTLHILRNEQIIGTYVFNDQKIKTKSLTLNSQDRTASYLRSVTEENKPVNNSLRRITLDTQTELASKEMPSFETGIGWNRPFSARLFITDRDKGELLFVDPADFGERRATLSGPITSSHLTTDERHVLYTTSESPAIGQTNIYEYILSTGEWRRFTTKSNQALGYKFSPYGNGSSKRCALDLNQQGWDPAAQYLSPAGTRLAAGYCSGLVTLEFNALEADIHFSDISVNILGWVSETHLLVRAENPDGSYRIVDYDITNGQENKIVTENFYWDQYWEILPDRSAVIYAASSITGPDYDACSKYGRSNGKDCAGGSDIYRVDLATGQRQQLMTNAPLVDRPLWSRDGSLAAFNAASLNDPYGIKDCWVVRVSDFKHLETIKGDCLNWVR